MKLGKKGIVILLISLILISNIWMFLWFYVINPLVPSPQNVIFSYKINGIYGENPRYENTSWLFTPLYEDSFYSLNKKDYQNGAVFTILLTANKCVIAQSYHFKANLTVYYMNVTVISNQTAVYFEEISYYNEINFDYEIFSIDLKIVVFIDTMKLPKGNTEGEIKSW